MQVKKVKISEIKTNPKNPRLIKDDKFKKLVKSIQEFPQMLELRPIVVDENNIVLGGNMRLKACIEVGLKEVYIVQAADLTEEQKNQFIVKDNVGFGEWDWDVLANEWEAVKLEEWGLDVWQLNMDNDFEDAEDIITNNEKYDHVDDIAVNYLNSDVKKFEIYINHEDYDTVVTKINSIKKNNNIENNSDAIVWLILNS
jgi:hypothetical protein